MMVRQRTSLRTGASRMSPQSRLIFNLTIEGLLRGIATASCSGYDFTDSLELRSLAYADDPVIAASSEEDMYDHRDQGVHNFCWYPV